MTIKGQCLIHAAEDEDGFTICLIREILIKGSMKLANVNVKFLLESMKKRFDSLLGLYEVSHEDQASYYPVHKYKVYCDVNKKYKNFVSLHDVPFIM